MKKFLYNWFKKLKDIKKIELEYNLEFAIPDIYIKLGEFEEVAIECQCSKISEKEIIQRTKKYSVNGIHVLWILGTKKYLVENHEAWSSETEYKRSKIEKWLQSIYFGRVYYCEKIATNEFHIVPVRFKSATRSVEWFTISPYTKYLKTIATISVGKDIENQKLLLTLSNDHLIARFMDKKWWENE